MKNTVYAFLLLFPGLVSATSCLPLYEQEGAAIQKKYGYTTYVNGHYYMAYGRLNYWQGIKVNADIDNWAEDLAYAVKWGPYLYFARSDDPRKAWLELFRKSIKSECGDLPQGEYKELRSMLSELMEDGSFCPNGEILKPGFMGMRHSFKKILEEAVEAGRFPEYCKKNPVNDDSFRNQKGTEKEKPSRGSSSEASAQ
jgi:hypothetical protein